MSGQHIFIVDDHAPVLRVLRLGLEGAGFRVSSACDGAECLAMLVDEQPDFLVTDIDMPKMTGRELCEAITQQFPDRQFPIIVLTARSELEHRNWTSAHSNLGFMEKPVSVRGLIASINETLQSQATKAAG